MTEKEINQALARMYRRALKRVKALPQKDYPSIKKAVISAVAEFDGEVKLGLQKDVIAEIDEILFLVGRYLGNRRSTPK